MNPTFYYEYGKSRNTNEFDLSLLGGSPTFIQICDGGTKMYYITYQVGIVYAFTLTVPYVISSAVYKNSFSIPPAYTKVNGAYISDSGLFFILWDNNNRDFYTFNMSSIWELPNSTFVRGTNSNTISTVGFHIVESINRLYLPNVDTAEIRYYSIDINNLDAKVLISTVNLKLYSTIREARDIVTSSDGYKVYVADSLSLKIWTFNLSTAFDMTTITTVTSFDISNKSTTIGSLTLSSDFMYWVGGISTNAKAHRLRLSEV
jgi:hypothetical protein